MLSRVADSLFWMSRYIERAENVARFIDVNLHLTLDLPTEDVEQWLPLVYTTGDHQAFERRHGRATMENVVHFLTFDRENPNSIVSCVRAARENARCVREALTSEMWMELNQFYLMLHSAAAETKARETPHDFFAEIRRASHVFIGVTASTLSHNEGRHFGRLGRLLERADKTSRILDVKYFILLPAAAYVGTPFDNLQWAAVLRSASALEMYRKRHGAIAPKRVAEFLLLDREFPRAVQYCIHNMEDSLHAISGTPAGDFRNIAERRIGQLRAELAYAGIEEILAGGLHEWVDALQTKLNGIGEAIIETFFAMRPVEEQIAY